MEATKATYDRARVEALLKKLAALKLHGTGRVALLVESPAPGRHEAREAVEVVAEKGFAGDYVRKPFYKGKYVPGREVSAMSAEVLRALRVDPVVVGDNLITEGLDLTALQPGDLVQVGCVVLRRSERPHRPCLTFRERTSPEAFAAVGRGGYRGALFTVEKGGTLHAGDPIRRLNGTAP